MRSFKLFVLLAQLAVSQSFLLETSTKPPLSVTRAATSMKLPATTKEVPTSPSVDADRDYQKIRDMVMEEISIGVMIKSRVENLKQNFSVALAALDKKISDKNNQTKNKVKLINSKYQNTVILLEQNISSIKATSDNLETAFQNISDISKTATAAGLDLENKVNNISTLADADRQEILDLEGREGYKSGYTLFSPESGQSSNTLKLNITLTNIGKQYNVTSGVFVCDYPGIYMFSLTLYKQGFANSVYCSIRHNGKQVHQTYLNPNIQVDYGFYASGASVVLHLDPDDTVDVSDCSELRFHPLNHRTTLTGFLLKADSIKVTYDRRHD